MVFFRRWIWENTYANRGSLSTGNGAACQEAFELVAWYVVLILESVLRTFFIIVRLARSQGKDLIQSIGICAGSGASVLAGVQADLYLTGNYPSVFNYHILKVTRLIGEMSHHEVLAAVSQGTKYKLFYL